MFLVAAVAVLLICLLTHFGRPRQFLEGFWAGDPDFLDDAGLEGMFLSLVPEGRGRSPSAFRCHVLMSTEAGIICNSSGDLRLCGLLPLHGLAGRQVHRCAVRLVLDDPGPLPARCQLVLDPAAGELALNDGKKVLALLRREPEN